MALEADEEWMTLKEKSPAPEPVRFARRKKIRHLDDLVADSVKEKLEKETKKKRKAVESFSDDEGDDDNTKPGLKELIEKCTAEVGSGYEIKEAPKWGERVFVAQAYGCSSTENDLTSSSPRFFPAIDHEEEDQFIDDIVENHVITTRDRFDRPEFLSRIFKKLARSQDLGVQRDNFEALRDYFLAHKNAPINWKPSAKDIREAFNFHGYQSQAPVDAGDDEPGPARDILWLMKCMLMFSQARLFQDPEIEELLPILFRCLLDRSCLKRYNLINECIEQLLNYVSPSSIQRIASSIARLSTELINIYHVLKLLRGDHAKVDALRKEAAFELLSSMNKEKLQRCASDVILGLDEYDPKNEVDFVKLYHHLSLADLWLRNDPGFKPSDESFAYWMQILRNFSVRIYCGDYRPFANEVRNRAAFLMSCYGLRMPR